MGGASQVHEQSEGEVSNLPVLPQAGQTVRGQQDVCLEPGGGEGDRADGGHHSCHTWKHLPRSQHPEQVSLNGDQNCCSYFFIIISILGVLLN